MFELNLNKLMADLVATDPGVQIGALRDFVDLHASVLNQTMEGMRSTDSALFLIEGIMNMVIQTRYRLEQLYDFTADKRLRTIVAIALLDCGSQKGLEVVLAEARSGGENEPLALRKLIQYDIDGAGDLVVERLRRFPDSAYSSSLPDPYVDTLLSELRTISYPIPDDIQRRLAGTGASAGPG